jgi:hypothetical protein
MSDGEPAEPDGSRVFVFGSNTKDWYVLRQSAKELLTTKDAEPCDGTYKCPAVYAGYPPGAGDTYSSGVANVYDGIVKHRLREGGASRIDGEDLLTEDVAKAAWLDAIAACRYGADNPSRAFRRPVDDPSRTAEVGEAIARDLGWLHDGESVPAVDVSEAFEPTV